MPQSETILRFVVRAPTRQLITVFTPHTIGPSKVTECLRAVSATFAGSSVIPAELAVHVDSHGDGNTYIYGTGGALKFAEPQTNETLTAAANTIGDALVSSAFGLYGPPEIEPEG